MDPSPKTIELHNYSCLRLQVYRKVPSQNFILENPLIVLSEQRHCQSNEPCSRTRHNDPCEARPQASQVHRTKHQATTSDLFIYAHFK